MLISAALLFALSACSAASAAAPSPLPEGACATEESCVVPGAATQTPDPLNGPQPQATATPEGVQATPEGVQATPATPVETQATQPPNYTPTPDLRLPPEQWQQWPAIPQFSPRAREIYAKGRELGNDPNAFSKVGDCQMINEAFFGIYATPGAYSFYAGEEYLQDTINTFGVAQFARESAATQGGFNAPAVFNPMLADPEICLPGETPLECEYRINKPSFMLISMEFTFSGRTAEVYEGYMRKIIEFAIEHGVVPIIATKADNVEGDHSINLATARLAYEYDIPLWNFWLAVQTLPNQGMDMVRNDGFHISVDAWNMRNYTAIKLLDGLVKFVAQP